MIRWTPPGTRTLDSDRFHTSIHEPRMGVMLHFDGSGSDEGSVAWFEDPRCNVSYQILVLDDGTWVRIAPDSARAWHAGVCKPSRTLLDYEDANSAFYGVSAATSGHEAATMPQLLTVAYLVRRYFMFHRWPMSELWRITGHEDEAWRRGRKSDPSGSLASNPILGVEDVRWLVPRMEI